MGILAAILGFLGGGCREQAPKIAQAESAGVGLRRQALQLKPDTIGYTASEDFPFCYAVLMDWDIGGTIATVRSSQEGAASIYTTSAFGIIGGEGHPQARAASIEFVKLAQSHFKRAAAVDDFPYPSAGEVFFYFNGYEGVRVLKANLAALENGASSELELWHAAQKVVTALRLITEEQEQKH